MCRPSGVSATPEPSHQLEEAEEEPPAKLARQETSWGRGDKPPLAPHDSSRCRRPLCTNLSIPQHPQSSSAATPSRRGARYPSGFRIRPDLYPPPSLLTLPDSARARLMVWPCTLQGFAAVCWGPSSGHHPRVRTSSGGRLSDLDVRGEIPSSLPFSPHGFACSLSPPCACLPPNPPPIHEAPFGHAPHVALLTSFLSALPLSLPAPFYRSHSRPRSPRHCQLF